MTLILATLASAMACGGFFCDSVTMEPVDQAGERILFKVADGRTTVHVEVRYEGRPEEFAWLVPLPEAIAAEDVTTTDASFLNVLERNSAPRFTFTRTPVDRDWSRVPDQKGCGCSGKNRGSDTADTAGDDDDDWYEDEEETVRVVDEATVGPFAIEVITATDATDLEIWLAANDYDIPANAQAPIEHYVQREMAFLGVKMVPNRVEGPIDTLIFSYPGVEPSIPLILTSVAAQPDMPVLAYVLADSVYRPANYAIAEVDEQAVRQTPDGTTYRDMVTRAVDEHDGQAFVVEYAGHASSVWPRIAAFDTLDTGGWQEWDTSQWPAVPYNMKLTRFRGELSPEEMVMDPYFVPAVDMPLKSNQHTIELAVAPRDPLAPRLGYAMLFLLVPWLRRRVS